ncbi:D-tyrosyl-tRNA(Tyr) deacylase [Amylibacter sp. SFDW26]|uniref:D-aminoacyl-tRNA deacylase n=1 Tax=Amylibacter sp. SFDW26 TaxID=2652722 RepID=UPI0012620B4B|nr:D-aminoacyl-tRNA deacylase [Amylibacter sp. SFDW26]KAB7613750.1 D-tyrosyl-tRNA(Tyr) deacylase [Amylibacter sp. SFDW26]
MRALIQRVKHAQVDVGNKTIGKIPEGLLVFICAMQGDRAEVGAKLALKVSKLRIFKDDEGRMNRSLKDIEGSALIISQFTLGADTSRGNRPGFSMSAPAEEGRALYESFIEDFKGLGIPVETGQFGADMKVSLLNDGPVTIWIDTEEGK